MSRQWKRQISILMTAIMVFSYFAVFAPTGVKAAAVSKEIEVTLAADAVSNNLDLAGFSEKLKTKLNSTYGIATDKIHINAVDSSVVSGSVSWNRFDHTNNASLAVNTPTSIVSLFASDYSNLMRDYHIVLSGTNINFYGYGSPAYKDFLYSPNSNANNKIFTFTMNEAVVDYHTGEGAGFLFNAKYTYNSASDRRLSAYMVLLGQSYINLYRFDNVEVSQFMNETGSAISDVAPSVGGSGSKWGGTVYNLGRVNKPSASSGTYRYLKLVASPETISFYQFTDSTYSVIKDKMFESVSLPVSYNSFGFGPIVSYLSHGCSSLTNINFSDVKMMEDTSVGFADIVRSTTWQYTDSIKIIANVDNDGVSDFGSTDKLASILYYTMLSNVHYVGWGMNSSINIGGYTTVKAQADGFIARNNGKGTFLNRSVSSTSTLDQGVDAIAAYIASQIPAVPDITKPNLTTVFDGSGSVTCTASDTVTSLGNTIGAYRWKVLDIASGVWTDKTGSTGSASFTFPQNTYSMVALSIQDSVTSQWSDYSYAYIATVATVLPISQFTVDKNTLMPDSSVDALKTGTVVTAADTSYLPNGGSISDWEWKVYDQSLSEITAMAKTYTSSSKPSSVTFDFNGKPAGSYTIKLKTKNGAAGWSTQYTQQVMIYRESTAITIGTSNSTSSPNTYSGSTSIPFTISSTGGNITSYRLIKVLKAGGNAIGDWTKVNVASVSSSLSISSTNCDVYVQAIDASGNSKTQFVGTYSLVPQITAKYAGTNTAYTGGTPTNQNITFTSTDSGLQYSANGTDWNNFSSPLTVSSPATYQFRFIGDTGSAGTVSVAVNINKTFSASVSGFAGSICTSESVTPIFSGGTATVSKNSGSQASLTSGSTLSDEGSYRIVVTDLYGNSMTYDFIIDKTLPTLTLSGAPTGWTSQDVSIGITEGAGLSGIKSVTVSKDSGTPVSVKGLSSYTVSANGTYVFTITNNAGVSVTKTVVIDKIDKDAPTGLTISVKGNLFKEFINKITFGLFFNESVDVTLSAEDSLSGIDHYEYQIVDFSKEEEYNESGAWLTGATLSVSPDFKGVIYARAIDKLGTVSAVVSTCGIEADSTVPEIAGADQGVSYYIGRVITFRDSFGELSDASYVRNQDSAVRFDSGTLFDKPGNYKITVIDQSGNSRTLSFTVLAIPTADEIRFSPESKLRIDAIKAELDAHGDLPPVYREAVQLLIQKADDRYSELKTEVDTMKAEISALKAKITALPGTTDGLVAMENSLQQYYDKILGANSPLTAEQRAQLLEEASYLSAELNTVEQLKEEASAVRTLIAALPSADKVTKEDATAIAAAWDRYSGLNSEQKGLLEPSALTKLNDVKTALSNLLLYDENTDSTVIGLDGTTFSPDVYLSVTPITETVDNAKINFAITTIASNSETLPELKGKELVALYDISLYQGNTVIEPDGRVQVRIKIPDSMKFRVDLDVMRINDDGSVVPMHAVVEDGYLVFITDHFSSYGVVASNTCWLGLCKALGIYEATGGICTCGIFVAAAVTLAAAGGAVLYHKNRKAKQEN